ncbi:MAG: response regulator [candidate division Zixibacteria bacterium]|nr:response regulator [candidate division Zixibacteria bacterium]
MARILIVDDDESIRHLARVVLSRSGHEVIIASSAAEAQRVADENAPIDLVLLDLIVPGPPWNDTLSSLQKRRPGATFILSSGNLRANIVFPEEVPADTPFLQKPYRSEDLIAMVAKTLGTE